jgi:hypothetical protein
VPPDLPTDTLLGIPSIQLSWNISGSGQNMPNFLLVCGDFTRPVGIIIMEAPSVLEAHTDAVARGFGDGEPFGEVHELSAKIMTAAPSAQIGRMMSGAEAARVIARLVEGRAGSPRSARGAW